MGAVAFAKAVASRPGGAPVPLATAGGWGRPVPWGRLPRRGRPEAWRGQAPSQAGRSGGRWGEPEAGRRAQSAPNNALEPTPNSLRSCLAAALGRGSPRALGPARRASVGWRESRGALTSWAQETVGSCPTPGAPSAGTSHARGAVRRWSQGHGRRPPHGAWGQHTADQGPMGTIGMVLALCPRGVLRGFCGAGPPDRKSTRLNSSHLKLSRMPSSA